MEVVDRHLVLDCQGSCCGVLIVREEDRVVVPEVRLQLHAVEHLLHVLIQVISECPYAHASFARPE